MLCEAREDEQTLKLVRRQVYVDDLSAGIIVHDQFSKFQFSKLQFDHELKQL